MKRGWFPRAVPPAGGLRAVRSPGVRTTGRDDDECSVNKKHTAKLAALTFRNRRLRDKPRFLLRQGRPAHPPPGGLILRAWGTHRGAARLRRAPRSGSSRLMLRVGRDDRRGPAGTAEGFDHHHGHGVV